MIRLYQEALQLPDMDEPLNRYTIGQLVGLQSKAVDTICNNLAQANFIKKHGKLDISITANGINLVHDLIN